MTEFYNTIEKTKPAPEPFSDEEFAEFDAAMSDISKSKFKSKPKPKPRRNIVRFQRQGSEVS